MEQRINILNEICTKLGSTTTHIYNIYAYNDWCVLAGGVGGHHYDINAVNELCVLYGGTGAHRYMIDAFNEIDTLLGGTGGWHYDIDALISISSNVNLLEDYIQRVQDDGGIVSDKTGSTRFMYDLKRTGFVDNVGILWFSGMGVKISESSGIDYLTKSYSYNPLYDIEQGSLANKPILTKSSCGSKRMILNPNLHSRYFNVINKLSFAEADKWQLTVVYDYNGMSITSWLRGAFIAGEIPTGTYISLETSGTNSYSIKNDNGEEKIYIIGNLLGDANGKNIVLTLVGTGSGSIKVYTNGTLRTTLAMSSKFELNTLLVAVLADESRRFFNGKIAGIISNVGEYTDSNISSLYSVIRSYIEEIETSLLLQKSIAKHNYDAVFSRTGAKIADGTAQATWITGTALWSYHNNALGVENGKLYNKAARDLIVSNPPAGFHVATEEELTAIAALNYSDVISTGLFSASGFRNSDGTFSEYGSEGRFWAADSDKALSVTGSELSIVSTEQNQGLHIKLISNTINFVQPDFQSSADENSADFNANTVLYSDIISAYDSLLSDEFTKSITGKDQSGEYDISVYNLHCLSDNNKKVLIYANEHGPVSDPRDAAITLYRFVKHLLLNDSDYVNSIRLNYNLYFIPVLNPWGFDNVSRYNFNGVDLNRNYDAECWADYVGLKGDSPFSEAETSYINSICTTNNIYSIVDIHCLGDDYSQKQRIVQTPNAAIRANALSLKSFMLSRYNNDLRIDDTTNSADPYCDVWANENGIKGMILEMNRFSNNGSLSEFSAYAETENFALLANSLKLI